MSIQTWWFELPSATRDWLISNNGVAVPEAILGQIEHIGGPARSDPWWTPDDDSTGVRMPDAAVDWIEEVANEETSGNS